MVVFNGEGSLVSIHSSKRAVPRVRPACPKRSILTPSLLADGESI